MKSAIVCYVCQKPKKYSETYAVKLIDYTEGVKVDTVGKEETEYLFPVKKIRVCRTDIKRMGYKIKKKKEIKNV